MPFYIARRYLFAKKSHNAINVISMVSVCGVAVATVAMICTLSVFNGFKELTTSLFSLFDPDIKITAVKGKVFDPTTPVMQRIQKMPEVEVCSEVLAENVLVRYNERQEIALVKGVDSSFRQLSQIDTAIVDGRFVLQEDETSYAVLGIGLAASLGVNAAFPFPLEIYMPKRTTRVNLSNPVSSFQIEYPYIGGVYQISQPAYDEGFMLAPIGLLRSMLDYEREVSAIELKLHFESDIPSVKRKIRHLAGDDFLVQDIYEQQEASFKMVQIEKWVTFLMLCFILVLALFNVVGALAILMIEKEEDMKKLQSMGACSRFINKIFLFEGWIISLIGAVSGVFIGLLFCFLQQRFGFISLGQVAGTFIVDAYPVKVEWADVMIVLFTVVAIGFLAALYPVHYLGNKWMNKKSLKIATVLFIFSFATVSCTGKKKEENDKASRKIAVSIEPQRFFAEKIAGRDYEFISILPTGQSPEYYDPAPQEMMKIGQSVAYLRLGLFGFEHVFMAFMKENHSKTRIFNLSEGMLTDSILGNKQLHNTACIHEEHSHHQQDPHIWTSFSGAKLIAENTLNALIVLNPERTEYYKSNYQVLIEELCVLENLLSERLISTSSRGFVIYHPALTYFAHELGLNQYTIEHEGKAPSPATLKQLIEEAKAAYIKVVFVQAEFDRKHADQIAAEIGARVVVINPLDYEWKEQMKFMVETLVENGETD